MGDSAARAEARRRRILENSQKRLERITGRAEKPISEIGISAAEDNLDNATIFTFQEALGGDGSSQLFPDYITEDTSEQLLLSSSSNNNQREKSNDTIPTIFKSDVNIIMLAVFTHAVQLMTNKVLTNYFFLPLIIFEITKYFSVDQTESNSLLRTVFGLSGISPHKLQWMFMIISFVQKTSQDACLYLFTYVILQLLIGFIL